MGSGKQSGGSKDYYGHAAGVICQGRLDFIWGILINNDLVYPSALAWDSRTYAKTRSVIYLDGNVYRASDKTNIDPTAFPWVLLATPWTAGTYHLGDTKLFNGNVWKAAGTTALQPQDTKPAATLGVQSAVVINGWTYVCTPDVWNPSGVFWNAGAIVAHEGRLYVTAVDTKAEPPDAPWTLWKLDLSAANPTKVTVEGMGDAYIYRGTPDQVLDAAGENVLSTFGHPPYRNKAVLVLKDFLFGTQQQNPPDVIVLGGRAPVQTLIVGPSAALDAEWQANPWCVLAELLTHPAYGLGLPSSYFDQASWQAEADRCAANSGLYYISPIYTNLKKIRELVADLLSYPDAFIFWSTVATLTAGHWPHGEGAPAFDDTNTVDRDAMLSEFDWESGGWGETANSAGVSFDDISSGFKSRPVFAPNLFNMQVVKRMQVQKAERPHIVRAAQALAWATELAKLEGDPSFKGEVDVRAEKAAAVAPGKLFLITDDVLGASVVQRCTKRVVAAAPAGRVTLTHEVERGVSPQPYAPTPTNPVATAGPSPSRIGTFGVAQLPGGLGPAFSLAVIAGRQNEVTVSYDAWFKQADGAAFMDLGKMKSFAVPGILSVDENSTIVLPGGSNQVNKFVGAVVNGSVYDLGHTGFWDIDVVYSSDQTFFSDLHFAVEGSDFVVDPDTGMLTIIAGGGIPTGDFVLAQFNDKLAIRYDPLAPQSDLDMVSEPLTADEIADGKILLFAFQADDPSLFEVMRVQSVVAAGNDTHGPVWLVSVLRSQFGTKKGGDGSHFWGYNKNDVMFIVRKDSLVPLEHESFSGFFNNGATMDMRLVPASAWVTGDVADVWDPATNPDGLTTDFGYSWATFNAPTASFGQTNVNGAAISDLTATFLTSDVFSFVFELGDVNGDLVSASLIASQAQTDVTLWSSTFDKTYSFNRTVGFSLGAGDWQISLRFADASGNHVEIYLIGGDGNPATLHVEAPAAPTPTAETPKIYKSTILVDYAWGILFGLHPATCVLRWQIQNRNVAYNPASWTVGVKYGSAIGGLYQFGTLTSGHAVPLPPVKRGSNGQTLYAYISRPGYLDSAVVFWNF